MTTWVPHNYQKQAVKWLVTKPEAALFLDPGLGKTSIALEALRYLRMFGGVRKALVIAPLRVCYMVWSHDGGELSKWGNFKDFKVSLLHGPKKDKALAEDAELYVINPDGLPWLTSGKRLESLFKRGVDVLVIDELSKFKHLRTRRAKLLKPYLGRFKRRWGLTGSPCANGLLDVFGQVYMVDLGRALGPWFTHFRHEYFVPSGYMGHGWKPQKDAEARIHKKLAGVALAMRAVDHLDLPALAEREIYVRLPKKAQEIYDAVEEDLFAALDSGEVVAANAAVASGKCRQIASGGVYDDKHKAVAIHDEKTEALVDLVDELQGSPLLVFYEFQHELDRIRAALGDVPALNGDTTPTQARTIVEQWNAGELPVLLAHPQAAGHGLNLQASGHHICWYSLTWNFELYDQAIRRVWRQGQKNRVTVYRLIARGTIDEAVALALASKKHLQNSLLDALKKYKKGKRK